jgi:Family of unknown function (DUF5681)
MPNRKGPKGSGYVVGYRRPPKSTQFKTGKSGNPRGRPKGARSVGAVLRDVIQQRIAVTENGRTRRIPALEVMLRRLIVRPDSIDIELREPTLAPAPLLDAPATAGAAASSTCTTAISLPWSVPAFSSVKRVLHQPEAKPTLKQETRDAILLAIAKARSWIDDLVSGRVQSFDEIAEREGKVERHIRLLTPLALIPPRTLAAIIDGTGPHDATVTGLAQAVPYRWNRSPAGQVSWQNRLA